MDIIGTWNLRRLNSPLKHIEVKNFLSQYNLGLLQTRVKSCNFNQVFPRVCGGYSICTNYQYHRSGRIWLIWLARLFVINICESSAQFTRCEVLYKATRKSFDVTVVYEFNGSKDRENVWRSLVTVSRRMQGRCVLIGNFNNVLNLEGRIGSPVTVEDVANFKQCVRDYNIFDMKASAPFFT